jgi:hypothetical protein
MFVLVFKELHPSANYTPNQANPVLILYALDFAEEFPIN